MLSDIDAQGFTSFLEGIVRSHLTHAERRLHEVQRAVAQLDEAQLPSSVLAGTQTRYSQTVRSLAAHPPAPDTSDSIESALAWLLNTSNETDTA